MSSVSVTFSRKRVHSPVYRDSSSDSTSDSEDEAPPVKIKRNSDRPNKFPVDITARLRELVVWVSGLPVKEYFQMAIKAGAMSLPPETIEIDDDDDVRIEEDRISEAKKAFMKRVKQSRNKLIETNGLDHGDDIESSSTRTVTRAVTSRFDIHPSANGFKNWDSRRNGSYLLRQPHTDDLSPAVISSPETDIEILLETKPAAASSLDGDEIEILSESPNIKHKSRSLPGNRQFSRAVSKGSASHPGSSQSEHSAATRSQSTKSQPYTAHEVVRLQEKAQYKLLLDKYINRNHYTPLAMRSKPDPEEDIELELSGSHFKKEIIQQPVAEFIEKYYRPCQLLLPKENPDSSDKETDEGKEVGYCADDDDDEIQIIDVKLPKYQPKYKHKADFYSSAWLNELKITVNAQTEERMKIVKEQEEVIENYKRDRLLKQLTIGSGSSETKEPEFPELTPDMEEEIDKALHGGKPDERLCKITSDYLMRKDFETLDGLNWLNDLVINSYFDLIVERSKQEGYPSVYAYNTFFYSTYKAKGYPGVRRWTRKIDIFSYDLNFIPLHLGVHWCLAVIDHRSKKICYYDSMGNEEEICLELLHDYLLLEHNDKKGEPLEPTKYVTEVRKDIPMQMNGSDCGMFTLKYAEYISRDAEITFCQNDMSYFRRRMVYELLHNKLL